MDEIARRIVKKETKNEREREPMCWRASSHSKDVRHLKFFCYETKEFLFGGN